MPTNRARHLITETDQVAAALDEAARRWPTDRESRSRLLVRLVEVGHQSLVDDRDERRRKRREAIQRTSGALAGTYEPGYLQRLREDWPE